MAARVRHAQRVARRFRLQVRDSVDGDRAVLVFEQHRLGQPADGGAQVQPARRGELRERAEPGRGVVVSGRDDQLRAGRADPGDRRGGHPDGLGRRHRAVVDVACHQDGVDRLAGHEVGEVPEHRFLFREQVGAVERAADVPVGGVQESHAGQGTTRPRRNRGRLAAGSLERVCEHEPADRTRPREFDLFAGQLPRATVRLRFLSVPSAMMSARSDRAARREETKWRQC